MGAETAVYVKIARVEWVVVDAVTLEEAANKVKAMPDTAFVMVAQYSPPK